MEFQDANKLAEDGILETDLCIVGAGPIGLAMATELDGAGMRVCVIESGARRPRVEDQELNRFETVGHPLHTYEPIRSRGLGGTSGLWFGRCAVPDPIDFEARRWVPDSGWPVGPDEVAQWIPHAAEFLGVPVSDSLQPHFWRDDPAVEALRCEMLAAGVHVFTPRPLPGRRFARQLRRSENVQILLRGTVVELIGSAGDTQVRELRGIASSGKRFRVKARAYVLAAGGMENPRILLLSRSTTSAGFANAHDTVGRYYMNHPRNEGVAKLHLDPTHPHYQEIRSRLDMGRADAIGASMQLCLGLSESVQRRERLLNGSAFVYAQLSGELAALADSLRLVKVGLRARRASGLLVRAASHLGAHLPTLATALGKRVLGQELDVDHFVVVDMLEQAPDPASRITLGDERDRFGLPQLRLDWRIGNDTTRSLRALHLAMAEQFTRSGIGRLESPLLEDPDHQPDYTDAAHPAGTTRMSDDPKRGVVDRDARVHGVRNLFVAGSSIFPTVGHAPPTLTAVALAQRLARHLRGGFVRGHFNGEA